MTTPDFFRARLDQMIDLRHPLAVLATRLPWASIEAAVAPKLAAQAKPAKRLKGEDLAGAFDGEFGGGVSPAGRPRSGDASPVGHASALQRHPRVQFVPQRLGVLLAMRKPLLGRHLAGLALDLVQPRDALNGLRRHRLALALASSSNLRRA